MKLSPRSIALTTAAIIALSVSGFDFFFHDFQSDKIVGIVILFVFVFVVAYTTVNYFLEKFIYNKIKILYKLITTEKSRPGIQSSNLDLKKDIIGEVSREVERWREDNQKEISRLKEMENFRREFVGNVAHELKTPLFNIQGYLSTLLEDGWKDPAINLEYLKRAEKSVDRMIQIVEELDIIQQLENKTIALNYEAFDITALVKDIFHSLEIMSKNNNIVLKLKENYPAIWVYADEQKIRRVLVNLIVNSIKYGKAGGGTTVVKFHDLDDKLLIEVSDDGIGIESEHLSRIFERFYRVEKSRSRDKGGSGLGLAIVKHILEAHGQTINVRSKPGEGTTFSFTLQKVSKRS